MRNINLEEKRDIRAQQLHAEDLYSVDHKDIIVYDQDQASTVIGGKQCTCTAASHHIHCICLRVAHILSSIQVIELEDGTVTSNTSGPSDIDMGPTEQNTLSANEVAQQQCQDIFVWLSGDTDALESHERKEDILKSMGTLHSLIFSKKFKKTTHKRKIEPNCSYLKSVEKAKKIKMGRDHIYVSKVPKKPKTKLDGGFQKTSRAVGGLRKTFQ